MTDQIEGSIAELAIVMTVAGSVFGVSSWAAFTLMQKLTRPSAAPSSPLLTMANVKHALKTLGYTALIGIKGSLLLGKICIEKSFSATWAITKFSTQITMNIAHFMAPHGIMQLLENRNIHSVGDFIGYCSSHTFSLLKNTTIGIAQFIGNGVKSVASATKNKILSGFDRLYTWVTGAAQRQVAAEAAEEAEEDNIGVNLENSGEQFNLAYLYQNEISSEDAALADSLRNTRGSTPPTYTYNLRPSTHKPG